MPFSVSSHLLSQQCAVSKEEIALLRLVSMEAPRYQKAVGRILTKLGTAEPVCKMTESNRSA